MLSNEEVYNLKQQYPATARLVEQHGLDQSTVMNLLQLLGPTLAQVIELWVAHHQKAPERMAGPY